MIICAGRIESFSFAEPIGIGLIESAITLTTLIRENKPQKILFVGTAGSYGKAPLLELFSSTTAYNIELSALQNQSYSPINPIQTSTLNLPFENVAVNSSNYITTDQTLAGKFVEQNIELENMEFFAVLAVANRFGVPAGGIFCTTNFCHSNAHKEFVQNHKSAMDMLTNAIMELI